MGSLAFEKPVEGQIISGVLVKRNFKYQIVAPSDISSKQISKLFAASNEVNSFLDTEYTNMTVSSVTQKMGVHYSGNIQTLQAVLSHVSPDLVKLETDKGAKAFRLFDAIDVTLDKSLVSLEVSFS